MHQLVQQQVDNNLLSMAEMIEDQVDAKLKKLENLDDDDLEKIRQRRVDEMKRMQKRREKWLQQGHGEYCDLSDEKDFFKEMKGEERMVVHFYRKSNFPCKVMDKHLLELSKRHIETKFCKIDAEKSPYLTEKLKIWMLPTLALIKNEKVVEYLVGLDDLGGVEDFKQASLCLALAAHGVLHYEGESPAAMPSRSAVQRKVRSTRTLDSSDEDSDFD